MFITEYSQVIQSLYFCCRYIGFGLVDSQAVYLRLRSLSLTTLVSVEVALRGRKDGGGGRVCLIQRRRIKTEKKAKVVATR